MNSFIEGVKNLPVWKKLESGDSLRRFANDYEVMFAILCSILHKFCNEEGKSYDREKKQMHDWANDYGISRDRCYELDKMVENAGFNAVSEIEKAGIKDFIDNFIYLLLKDKKDSASDYRLLIIVAKYLGVKNVKTYIDNRLSLIKYRLIIFFDSPVVSTIISLLIVLNSVQLGLAACEWFKPYYSSWFDCIDMIFVAIFSIEILCRVFAFRKEYFREPQNIFDILVISISWMPLPGFHWLSAFRIFRTMLLLNRLKQLKSIMSSLLDALPNIGWVSILLGIFFYVFAVVTTTLFGAEFESFSSIDRSLFSLFQLMTLEGWTELVFSVMDKYPFAWLIFVPFMLITSYVFLNLVVGIIVTTMQDISLKKYTTIKKELEEILKLQKDIRELTFRVDTISKTLNKDSDNSGNDK